MKVMNRRKFIKYCIASGLSFPFLNFAHSYKDVGFKERSGNTLILVELKGGNDGLNTVVPYSDPLYYEYRPSLGLKENEIVKINNELALHHSMEGLMPLWEKKQCAIILGIGYDNPNLSHFRSIEIWDTASESDEYVREGWLNSYFKSNKMSRQDAFIARGLVLGGSSGPLALLPETLQIRNLKKFLRKSTKISTDSHANVTNRALKKLIDTENIIAQAADNIKLHLKPLNAPNGFPKNYFSNQLALAAQVIQSNLGIPVIKVSLRGFDTHARQKVTHARLLKQLTEGFVNLESALAATGHWQKTTIMTYSEFGRRPKENGSAGTDHGTAAPHFLLGGSVKGGLFGKQPQLAHLDSGNLKYTTHFKQLYKMALDVTQF